MAKKAHTGPKALGDPPDRWAVENPVWYFEGLFSQQRRLEMIVGDNWRLRTCKITWIFRFRNAWDKRDDVTRTPWPPSKKYMELHINPVANILRIDPRDMCRWLIPVNNPCDQTWYTPKKSNMEPKAMFPRSESPFPGVIYLQSSMVVFGSVIPGGRETPRFDTCDLQPLVHPWQGLRCPKAMNVPSIISNLTSQVGEMIHFNSCSWVPLVGGIGDI